MEASETRRGRATDIGQKNVQTAEKGALEQEAAAQWFANTLPCITRLTHIVR
jgi:hypothetical protein